MMSKIPPNCVLVTGHAQIPKGTALYEHYKIMDLVLIINLNDDLIVNAEFTFLTRCLNEFLKTIIIGRSLSSDLEDILEDINNNTFFPARKAVVKALQNAQDRYEEVKTLKHNEY